MTTTNILIIALIALILIITLTATVFYVKKNKIKTPYPEENKPQLEAIKNLESKLEKVTENQSKGKDELKHLLTEASKEAIKRKSDLTQSIIKSKAELNQLLTKTTTELKGKFDAKTEALKSEVKNKNEALKGDLKEAKTALTTSITGYSKRADELIGSVEELKEVFSKGTKSTGNAAELIGLRLIKSIGSVDYQGTNNYLSFSYQQPFKTDTGKTVIPDITIKGNDKEIPTTYLDVKWPQETFKKYLSIKKEVSKQHKEGIIKAFVSNLKADVKAVSDKYLNKKNFKNSFAILFLPSDRLFEAAIEASNERGVNFNYIEWCFDLKIVPTSPSTLIGVLSTLERYYDLFKKLKERDKDLKWIEDWDRRFKAIRKHIEAINREAGLIVKKTDEIGKQMLLNERTAARLPLKELNEEPADKTPLKLKVRYSYEKNKAPELTDEQLKVINDAANSNDDADLIVKNADDGIKWR